MSQGRGSAVQAMTVPVAVTLICLLVNCGIVKAATYTVGGSAGWTFNMVNWPKGKAFRAGDILVFKYGPSMHNVVAVNRAGYSTCKTPRGARVYRTGNDQIKLVKGLNFFLCNFPGHCQSGMKIAVNAI